MINPTNLLLYGCNPSLTKSNLALLTSSNFIVSGLKQELKEHQALTSKYL